MQIPWFLLCGIAIWYLLRDKATIHKDAGGNKFITPTPNGDAGNIVRFSGRVMGNDLKVTTVEMEALIEDAEFLRRISPHVPSDTMYVLPVWLNSGRPPAQDRPEWWKLWQNWRNNPAIPQKSRDQVARDTFVNTFSDVLCPQGWKMGYYFESDTGLPTFYCHKI